MQDSTVWGLLYLAIGLIVSIFWSPNLAPRLGLPLWIVFIAVWIDVALVINSPAFVRHYVLTWRLLAKGPSQPNLLRVSRLDVILLLIVFVGLPVALLFWALMRWFS